MAAQARRFSAQFRLLDLVPSRPKPTLVPDPPPVENELRGAAARVRASLEPALAAHILSGAELIRTVARRQREEVLPTALEPLDALLGGGLPRGKMIEIVARRGAGRFSIILAALAASTSIGEAAALIDLGDHFDPQAAEADGVDLRRLLWVRPRRIKHAVMSTEMLMATGFQLVALDMGLHPLRGTRAPDAAWVRLARAAGAHGTALLVSAPYSLTGTASEAQIRGHQTRAQWLGQGRAPRVLQALNTRFTLEKHRHRKPGAAQSLLLRAES